MKKSRACTHPCIAVGLLGVLAVAQPSAADDSNFVTVPPIWGPSGGSTATAWIGARTVCDYVKGKKQNPADLADLAKHCDALQEQANRRSLEDLLKNLQAVASRIVKLNRDCREEPTKGSCPELYGRTHSPVVVGGDRIAALASAEDSEADTRPSSETQPAAKGGSVESQFVEGLTNFVLDRAKLEAIAYFEERFHNTLCEADKDATRVAYFPAVCTVLASVRSAGFSLASASHELREAARRDLRTLPDRALAQQYLDKGKPAYALLRVWVGVASKLRTQALRADQIFAALAGVNMGICNSEDCEKALRSLTLVGSALDLRARLREQKPVTNFDVIDAMLLVYRARMPKARVAKDEKKVSALVTHFVRALETLNSYETLWKEFKGGRTKVEIAFKSVKEATGDRRKEALRDLGAALAVLADTVLDLADAASLAFGSCTADDCPLGGNELRQQIADLTRDVRRFAHLTRNILDDRWTVVAVDVSQLFLAKEGSADAVSAVGRFAPVITELAAAQSSTEVQKILNEAAAPVGSYREKYRGNLRSITAFVGYSGGKEYIRSDRTSTQGEVQGLFAPIGFHVTTPTTRKGEVNGAMGVFFSVLDLGAYATYRNSDDSVNKQPNIGLKQLLSPGAYLTYSISWSSSPSDWFYRSPWVVGFGVARTPALLKTQTGEDATSTRVQAFVAVDVTLFPF